MCKSAIWYAVFLISKNYIGYFVTNNTQYLTLFCDLTAVLVPLLSALADYVVLYLCAWICSTGVGVTLFCILHRHQLSVSLRNALQSLTTLTVTISSQGKGAQLTYHSVTKCLISWTHSSTRMFLAWKRSTTDVYEYITLLRRQKKRRADGSQRYVVCCIWTANVSCVHCLLTRCREGKAQR